jgi:hypothetical protein
MQPLMQRAATLLQHKQFSPGEVEMLISRCKDLRVIPAAFCTVLEEPTALNVSALNVDRTGGLLIAYSTLGLGDHARPGQPEPRLVLLQGLATHADALLAAGHRPDWCQCGSMCRAMALLNLQDDTAVRVLDVLLGLSVWDPPRDVSPSQVRITRHEVWMGAAWLKLVMRETVPRDMLNMCETARKQTLSGSPPRPPPTRRSCGACSTPSSPGEAS